MTDRIKHQSINQTKTVVKPWGQEKWIQAGNEEHTYVLKEIVLKEGFRTSIQVHKHKAETNYILEGTGELWYSNVPFDCDKYANGEYDQEFLDEVLANLQVIEYSPGSVMQIEPGTIHRMVAKTDLRFVEASTCHLDDVIRLQDDANRSHGKIESEHK
jgi:quercetin dioxygenase-like cupin family protein